MTMVSVRSWSPQFFVCPGDQAFFRCDNVSAELDLYHVRQARCPGCFRRLAQFFFYEMRLVTE
jgi:hypothetical protein